VVDPDPVVACQPASGSSFAIGTTTVTCTATDDEGNVATGSFRVTIEPPEGIALLGVYVDPWVALLIFTVLVIAALLVDRAWVRKRRRDREEPRPPASNPPGVGSPPGGLTPGPGTGPQRKP
jgi:hypothetical protein